jgi:hypothetical protein
MSIGFETLQSTMARQILTETAKGSDAEAITQLRGLLKDIGEMLTPADDDLCECGADDDGECTCEEDAEDLMQATHILRELAFELKGHIPRTRLRW